MKKNIFRIAALLMAGSMIAIACAKKDPTPKPDPKPEPEPSEDVQPVPINIDGDFSDWALITEDEAAKNEYVAIAKAQNANSPIKVIKASCDADNVYIYAEVTKASLAHSSICGEWGSSMDGVDGFRGDQSNDPVSENDIAFNLFFDPDANVETGFYPYSMPVDEEEEDPDLVPYIEGLGCEQASQNLFFWNGTTNKVGCAWSQTNVGPVKRKVDGTWVDYNYNGDFFQQDGDDTWDSEDMFHRYGWQNDGYSAPDVPIEGGADGTGDNIAPAQGNLNSKLVGDIVYIEFSIDIEELVNWKASFDEYAWGVCYNAVVKDDQGNIDYEMWAIGPVKASYYKE